MTRVTVIGRRRGGCSFLPLGQSTPVGGSSTPGSHALTLTPSLHGSWKGWRRRESRRSQTSKSSRYTRRSALSDLRGCSHLSIEEASGASSFVLGSVAPQLSSLGSA